MKYKKVKVFEFDELSEEAKNYAIYEEIDLMLQIYTPKMMSENFKRAIDMARLKTPWFTMFYVYDYCLPEIVELIKLNKYLFTQDGKLYKGK